MTVVCAVVDIRVRWSLLQLCISLNEELLVTPSCTSVKTEAQSGK